MHSLPGLVNVLRQKVFISHNASFKLFHNTTALYISQNQVQKYTSQVSTYSNSKCGAVSTILMKYGFSGEQADYIITSAPEILNLDEKSIKSNIINWFSFKMSEKNLFRSLTSSPELLLLNPEFVNAHVRELLTVFTNKDILKLLKIHPKVFLEDWDTIMEKMEYLLHYMGAEQKTIVKHGALQYSLEHMRQRHLFLLYTGKFKSPTAKKKPKNPPLDIIFGKLGSYLNLTGLCKEEYVAFCEVFPDIVENLDTESDTNDSDTSDDDDR